MAESRLVSINDAAKLLQEFMPGKDARRWLSMDAQRDPIIPHILRNGVPHYLMSDLAAFVQHFLDPVSHVHPMPAELAGQPERRDGRDRRVNPPLLLAPGIERRDYSRGDRRGNGATERRVRTIH